MSLEKKVSIAIVGATGKNGRNILRELSNHTGIKQIHIISRNNAALNELKEKYAREKEIIPLEFDELEKLVNYQPNIVFVALRASGGDTFKKGIYERSAQLAANFDLMRSTYLRMHGLRSLIVNLTNPLDIFSYVGCVYAEKSPYEMLGLSSLDTIRLHRKLINRILDNHPQVRQSIGDDLLKSGLAAYVIGLHEKGFMIPVFEDARFLGFKADLLASVSERIDYKTKEHISKEFDAVRQEIISEINTSAERIKQLLGEEELANEVCEPARLVVDAYLDPDLLIPASTFLYKYDAADHGIFIGNRVRIIDGRAVPEVITGLEDRTKQDILRCFNYAEKLINDLHFNQGMPYTEELGLVAGQRFTFFKDKKTGRPATIKDICAVSGFEESARVFAASGNQVLGWFPDQPNEPVFELNYKNKNAPEKSRVTCVRHKKLDEVDKLFIGVRGKIIQLDYSSLKVDAVYVTGADKYVRDIDFTSDGFVAVDGLNLYGWNYNTPARKKVYTGASGKLKTVKAIKHQGIEKILVPGNTVYLFDAGRTENPVEFKGVRDGEEIRSVIVDNLDSPTCVFGAGQKAYRWNIRNHFNPEISEKDFDRPYIGYSALTRKLFVGDQINNLVAVLDAETLEIIGDYNKGLKINHATGYLRFACLGQRLPRNWLLASDLNLKASTGEPFLHIFDPTDNNKPYRTLIGAKGDLLYFDTADVTDVSLDRRVMNLTL